LSGGEGQRIRLATQIGSQLRGVLYVLDEPSIGLHPRDNRRLLDTLAALRDLGNTVLVLSTMKRLFGARTMLSIWAPARARTAELWWRAERQKNVARNPNQ
jgi:ABC-type ATPase involved in cell division